MITEEKCKNCDGVGYLFDEDLLFITEMDKKMCPTCFGLGYIFHHTRETDKRGAYEKSNN